MQTVTDNTPAQINAALIAMEKEIQELLARIKALESASS